MRPALPLLVLLLACGEADRTVRGLSPGGAGGDPEGGGTGGGAAGAGGGELGAGGVGGVSVGPGGPGGSAGAGVGPGGSGGELAGAWPALQTELPIWHVEVDPEQLAVLDRNLDDRDLEVPGRFRAEGFAAEVNVRYRGRSTRHLPKKSFEVIFADGVRFEGKRKLELLAAWKDGGYLTEKTWYDLAAAAGVRAPRTRFVELVFNGAAYGVMTEIERVDKAFLRAHGFDEDSDVYRCGMHDCELREGPKERWQESWSKHTNEDQPWTELHDFLRIVNRTPADRLAAELERWLDLDAYLAWMAVDAAIANYGIADSRSYLVFDRTTRRFAYVPWDLNNAVSLYNRTNEPDQGTRATHPAPSFTAYDPVVYALADSRRRHYPDMKPAWSVLSTRILDDPGLRARYLDALRRLLEGPFRLEELGPRIASDHALVGSVLHRDPWVDLAFAERSDDQLERYVRERRAYLLDRIEELERHGQGTALVDRVGRDAAGRSWVELHQPGDQAFELEDASLVIDLRRPGEGALPSLRIPAGGELRLDEGGALPFELPADGGVVGLFAADGRTLLDALWFPPLAPGESWGRMPRGAETQAR